MQVSRCAFLLFAVQSLGLRSLAENLSVFQTNQSSAQFFRVISRWGTQANPIEPNAEMAVVELGRESYDPRNNRRYRLGSLPTPGPGVIAAAFLDGWIHLPGGGTARAGSSGSAIHQVSRVDQQRTPQ